ncbi:hypothetical protein GE061_012440 [Apolygus lucorum]|uniref:Uncharacterized protein n=1 Tax=Apolygus lucorum TaxID=248454 RepID=A0A6A4JK45_APOLU|nr:hypothetical protein GE061_012440 [Apolygus lucorum]
MVSMGQKEIIFGIIEASLGLATAISFGAIGGYIGCSSASYNALVSEGLLAGLVPILMRWTLKFWQSGSLPKVPELVICIWAISCYLVGGVFVIICVLDNKSSTQAYIPAVFAIVVGVMTLVDLIMGLM